MDTVMMLRVSYNDIWGDHHEYDFLDVREGLFYYRVACDHSLNVRCKVIHKLVPSIY